MRDKIMSATFDFNDFLTQMEMMQNMGGMGGLMKMMPGMSGMSLATGGGEVPQGGQIPDHVHDPARASVPGHARRGGHRGVAPEAHRPRRGDATDKDLANLIVMFGGMRVKMQKLTEQMRGAAADVGLTPQLSAEDMNQLAMEGVLKSVSPGMVRRQKIKKVPKNGAAQSVGACRVERV